MSGFIFAGIAMINTSTTGIVQTFGKFTRQMGPGLNVYVPFFQKVSVVSNRLEHQASSFQVKTKDNVFAVMDIAVQHKIDEDKSSISYFSLKNPKQQIDAYIENVIRSSTSRMTIDELFESRDTLCENVKTALTDKMNSFGYRIENVLVTNIDPDHSVKEAMNKINASKRLFESAKFEAEAKYVAAVKEAEGDRDRKKLQGEGTALQRKAIVDGYCDGVKDMSKELGIPHEQIIDFVLKTQQLDTFEHIGRSTNTKTIFIPYGEPNNKQRVFESMSYSNEIAN